MIRSLLIVVSLFASMAATAANISVHANARSPQADYAARRLDEALRFASADAALRPGARIELKLDTKLGTEAFRITSRKNRLTITGGDARGLIYGALEARQQLLRGVTLADISGSGSTPRLAFRGIKFNTPWDTYRASTSLSQHIATAKDPAFWEAYLDMMVENRFNTFTLWTLHPFTYMVKPRNFPEASKWSEAEFALWQQLYRQILRLAKERGLDTYVVFWSIFVSEEFARAHDVAQKNFYPHYYVDGDTSDITKRYLRESVAQMLEEYPDLDGIGVSHGEGMGGMTPAERQKFVDEVYIAGALAAKRKQPVKLIHRVPFSSGLSSGPGVSADVEKITRSAMEKLGNQFAGPIWAEMKFNWSHGHSTPKLIKVHGGKLGDTYFSPAPSNYKVVWQVRNEDFFALRWGNAQFIREHIRENGGHDYVGGYFVGSETYIPALDYFSKREHPDWRYAFERQWLFYKLWGRLLYDPATPDAAFAPEFTRRAGADGVKLQRAYELASRVPLTLASIFDSRWDFTLYAEGFLALQGEITKYIGVDALIAQPTLDPRFLSITDFVKGEKGGFADDLMTPLETAERLERDCREALTLVANIDTSRRASMMYEVADVRIWASLGLHLAEKLRGGVALQRYRTAGDESQRTAAVRHLGHALDHWDEVIRISRPLYKDMPLTHYNHNGFDANPDNLFHWEKIRGEVARDVELARASTR